jgi:hypothetical protein
MGKRTFRDSSRFEYHAGTVIGRELNESQQSTLRCLPGIDVSPTSFGITLRCGDGTPEIAELFERIANVYLQFDNRGPRGVTFRIPASALSMETVQPYLVGDEWEGLTARLDSDDLLLRYAIYGEDNEGFNMGEEGDGWLHLIAPVWAELMAGHMDALELGALLEEWGARTDGEPDLPGDYGLSKASRILAAYMLIESETLKKWANSRNSR